MTSTQDAERSIPRGAPEESWGWSAARIAEWQLAELNNQLDQVLPANRFYSEKFGARRLQLRHLDELRDLPLTTKDELSASAERSTRGVSAHQTYAPNRYSRIHRTSGTTGPPLMILDTAQDWDWWSATWQHVLCAARVTGEDRVFLAFSFGPFIGFWSAHQACVDRGATVVPGGGLSSLARLEFMRQSHATVVCCTPSYALHLIEVARREEFPLSELRVDRLIVAGESGGSVLAVRERLQEGWGAQVIDHSGATEIGPWGFGWPDRPGLHVIETSFIAELLPLENSADDSGLAELVLTSLGRYGAPVFRYRTGDIVRPGPATAGAAAPAGGESSASCCGFMWLPEGVVGRADDMVTVRGVNIFPSSIEALVRRLPGIVEYRVRHSMCDELDQLCIEVESEDDAPRALEKSLATELGLRIAVRRVDSGSLPRSELKARRWVDDR